MIRFTTVGLVLETPTVGMAALYPAITSDWPSMERVINPSEVAKPLVVSPLPLFVLAGTGTATVSVGMAWLAVVESYWMRETAVAPLFSAADPSPTRRMTTWPGVNWPGDGPVVKPTNAATTARR